MKKIKQVLMFIVPFLMFFVLLTAVNAIPQNYIKDNITKSVRNIGEYKESNIISGLTQTSTDNLHDLYIMQTVYYSSGDVVRDTLLPQYNEIRNEDTYINDALNQMGINKGLDYYVNFTGINILLKPLFMIFTLSQIKILNAIILVLLIGLFIFICERNSFRKLWVSFIIGFLMTYSFLMPISLNYIYSLLTALILSIIILIKKKETNNIFILIGVLSVFIDNYSNGSLIFVLPLLTMLVKAFNYSNYKEFIKNCVNCLTKWLISMFSAVIIKIGLTYFLYRENLLEIIMEKIEINLSIFKNMAYMLYQNITKVFPLKSTNVYNANVIIILILVFVFMAFLYTYKDKRKNINVLKILSYLTISVIPILYLIIIYANSYVNSYITYRNLLGSIMCISLIAIEVTEFKKLKEG